MKTTKALLAVSTVLASALLWEAPERIVCRDTVRRFTTPPGRGRSSDHCATRQARPHTSPSSTNRQSSSWMSPR